MKNRTAIIIFKKGREKLVHKIMDCEIGKDIDEKKLKAKKFHGSVTGVGDKYSLYQFRDAWTNYKYFDEFLLRLARQCKLNNIDENGLMLGHMDENGFFWTDYIKITK